MENVRWLPTPLLWIVLCVCGALVFTFNVLEIQTYSMKSSYSMQPKAKPVVFTEDMQLRGFLVRTPGCTIPEMKTMDGSIRKFIFQEKVVRCNGGLPALIESNSTSLYVIESSLTHYSINDTEMLQCCYQPFYRVDPKGESKDQVVTFDKTCYEFNDTVLVNEHEFVRVICKYNQSEIYKDFFGFVPLKNASKERAITGESLNVLIIGVDAVSRLNLHRQMPKTVGLLNKLIAVEMLGYNKVGDNTFPNLIPVLTGLNEKELQKTCWPKQNKYFDKCPFIWKNFNESGFTTAFGEDAAWMGLFYYSKKGFKHQPTDYYWDHFDLTAEKQIGNTHRLNVDQCIGARSVYKVFLDYISKYVEAMQAAKRDFFGFFWGASLSHDFLNKPKLGDQDYYDLIFEFNRTGVLNNTALIFLSDHGIRWGDIRSTYQGRMEERLPFLYIVLPRWYTMQNSLLINNLKTNRRRLTTPFDLHETLKDLVNSHNLTNEILMQRAKTNSQKRGYSLFDKITPDRTCEDAGISSHWCTCQTSQKIDTDNTVVVEAANFTVNDHINEMLIGYADCAVLELDEVLDARLQVNTADLLKSHFSQDYTITFRTKPGGALFEATVRKYITPKDSYFNVTGTVSRINLYGKQSLCVTDFHLKLYCYCKQYFSR